MNNQITKSNCIYNLFFGITTFCTIISSSNFVSAQIIPDNTLPNNSQVGIEGNTTKIEGGTTAGGNLFHSFEKFGVTTGGEAHFNNAVDINNIITRVTGNSISEIDGLIKANGAANLFLINPNGIVFGENVKLDIGGSFVGSTADAIRFGENNFFSASNPDSSSLLKVNPSALFFNQVKAASIESNSVAQEELNSSGDNAKGFKGLRVPNGKSLLLVGGDIDIDIDGGRLWALGGHIELGGLAGKGIIGLNLDEGGNNIRLSFPEGVEKSNVTLNKGMSVDVRDGDGGSIAVNARNLKMTDNSSLLAGIRKERGTDDSRAGGINVNVTDEINLDDGSLIDNRLLPKAKGQGGDINIDAGTLLLKNGAQVRTNNRSKAKGGNLTVNAQDVQLIGTNEKGRLSGLFSEARPGSTGDAGDVTINASSLLLEDGGQVNTSTFVKGKGGNLIVNAENIRLIGTNKYGRPSGFFAQTLGKATGDAGNLTIKTNTLLVQDGAQVDYSTINKGDGGNLTVNANNVQLIGTSKKGFSSGLFTQALKESTGDGGNINIKTNTLLLKNRAQVSSATNGKGKAGNLTVDAQEVQLIGKSGLLTNTGQNSTGNAGNLTIKTDTLKLENGAKVSVQSLGTGVAGNLDITANSIKLDKGSNLATTESTDGGNINLNIADLLIMRNGSQISTTAGGAGAGGNGGNININIPNGFIVATPNQNNDITANAFEGNGGRVTINAAGIFGMIPRSREELVNLLGTNNPKELSPSQLPTNDITAISQQNPDFSGNVEIITPQTDPTSGSIEFPTIPVDTEIADTCSSPGYAQSSFTITGKGSLPPSPLKPLVGRLNQTKLATLDEVEEIKTQTRRRIKKEEPIKQIVEAQGWVRTKNGEIILVAHNPQNTNSQTTTNSVSCNL